LHLNHNTKTAQTLEMFSLKL